MPFLLLVAYASGIATALMATPWQWPVQCVLALLLSILWFALRTRSVAWLPCIGLLFLCGQVNASWHLDPPAGQGHVAHFADGSDIAVEGTLLKVEQREPEGHRLLVDTHLVAREQQEAQVSGKLLLYIKSGELAAQPGQILRWRSRLRRPNNFGNPGEFDYPLHLATQGIYVTTFVKRAADLAVLVNHPLTSSKPIETLRQQLAGHIEACVPAQEAGLLQSLLLGKRDLVTSQQRRQLAESGVAHLFAISGLHFGLLALFLYLLGKWIYTRSRRLLLWQPPQRVLPLLLLPPLFAYMLLTGNAWGTRRAFLMVAFVALLFSCSRRTPPLALLATTALTILIFNPLAIFQPGFQLSFSGVAGILLWLPGWQKLFRVRHKLVNGVLLLFLSTAAATLATMPATLWHFHQFAPAGLLANLVAIPLIAWGSVPIGLVSLTFLPVAGPLAEAGLQLAAFLIDRAITLSTMITQLPGLKVIPHYLTYTQLVILVGILICLVPVKKNRQILIGTGITSMALAFYLLTGHPPKGAQITALSVGQGDATLISLGDKHYLVDGGGMPESSIDTGEHLVAPALGRLGIKTLDGVLLTHNHPDHSTGLAYILNRFPVKSFFSALKHDDIPRELLLALDSNAIPVITLREGWTNLSSQTNWVLQFFTPDQSDRNLNERSVAVYVGDQETGALMTSDLGKPGLRQLLAEGLPGDVSLLKLPHHGSRHARPDLYLEALQPQMAFVSSGLDNVYGFPHHESLQACEKHDTPLFRTDISGILSFHLERGKWQPGGHWN